MKFFIRHVLLSETGWSSNFVAKIYFFWAAIIAVSEMKHFTENIMHTVSIITCLKLSPLLFIQLSFNNKSYLLRFTKNILRLYNIIFIRPNSTN